MVYIGLFLLLIICSSLWGWIAYMREQKRREREGFWVESLGPAQLRADDDDMAMVYHEGERWQFFYGKTRSNPYGQQVFIPDEEDWQRDMPDWLQGRRALIVERIQQKFARVQILNQSPPLPPGPTREEQIAKYREEGDHVLVLPDGSFIVTPPNGVPSTLIKQEEVEEYKSRGWIIEAIPGSDMSLASPPRKAR